MLGRPDRSPNKSFEVSIFFSILHALLNLGTRLETHPTSALSVNVRSVGIPIADFLFE
jgi:hypothetical protein